MNTSRWGIMGGMGGVRLLCRLAPFNLLAVDEDASWLASSVQIETVARICSRNRSDPDGRLRP